MTKRGILILLFIVAGLVPVIAQAGNNIVIDSDIRLVYLTDSVYIHESWHSAENGGRFPSNGLIIIRRGEALIIDTPMDNDKTMRLVRYLKDSMSVDAARLIIGHFHDDCLGGLGYLQSIGVESVANSMTVEKCIEIGLPVPTTAFTDSLIFDFNGEKIECIYPGAGHSFDNIIVWIPGEKILFGGCLVKSLDSRGLGNLSDAVVADWDLTIERIIDNYPGIKTVIPGHGNSGGPELLSYTIELVKREKNR